MEESMIDYGEIKGPYHSFYLFDNAVHYQEAFSSACREKSNLLFVIPDDLLRYFHNFLSWIPTFFFVNKSVVRSTGLDYEGWSMIDIEGKLSGINIFNALIELFENGPHELKLRGLYDMNQEDYQILSLKKEAMISFLKSMLLAIEQINDNNFILHLGI
jgi:hypothetical protein